MAQFHVYLDSNSKTIHIANQKPASKASWLFTSVHCAANFAAEKAVEMAAIGYKLA